MEIFTRDLRRQQHKWEPNSHCLSVIPKRKSFVCKMVECAGLSQPKLGLHQSTTPISRNNTIRTPDYFPANHQTFHMLIDENSLLIVNCKTQFSSLYKFASLSACKRIADKQTKTTKNYHK